MRLKLAEYRIGPGNGLQIINAETNEHVAFVGSFDCVHQNELEIAAKIVARWNAAEETEENT